MDYFKLYNNYKQIYKRGIISIKDYLLLHLCSINLFILFYNNFDKNNGTSILILFTKYSSIFLIDYFFNIFFFVKHPVVFFNNWLYIKYNRII